jgi:hypothetical protein
MTRILVLLLTLAAPFLHAQGVATTTTVTPALERTAFADSGARITLMRAREARMRQDSALRAYDVKAIQRQTIWMAASVGPKKLLLRQEQASRIRWSRDDGVFIDPLGRRAAFPLGDMDIDGTAMAPIPFFPGRETLWYPLSETGLATVDVDEADLKHPLARGAEAYYRYATGDSLTLRFPDGTSIFIRELRITPRRPSWRHMVGSFWFDIGSGALVRAVYRGSAPVDLWETASEEMKREVDSLRTLVKDDTGDVAWARKRLEEKEMGIAERIASKIAEGTFRPLKGEITAITVEYALFEQRFWLPKLNVAEGEFDAMMMRVPIRWEERFEYADVNGTIPMPVLPPRAATDTIEFSGDANLNVGASRPPAAGERPEARRAEEDSILALYRRKADSLYMVFNSIKDTTATTAERQRAIAAGRAAAMYARWAAQIERRHEGCAKDSVYFAGKDSRYDGAVKVNVFLPCDETKLRNSKELPGSITDPSDVLFDSPARQQLLDALDFSLQPPWAPQRPRLLTGLQYTRFNRLEGLSVGGGAVAALGLGLTADGTLRYGFADRIPNLELGLARSNGRVEYRLAGFSGLKVANDDWGSPLSVRASISNLLYGRDEGFYYRAAGASLTRTSATAPFSWRLFGEQQRGTGVEPRTSLWDSKFGPNIDATPLAALGGGLDAAHTFGGMTNTARFTTRLRAEGAFTDRSDSLGTSGYGRVVLGAGFTKPIGPFAVVFEGSAATSAGTLPIQRAFFAGGSETVRGQSAQLVGPGRVGDAMWLARTQLEWGVPGIRLIGFYDAGWAGSRRDLSRQGRPLTGAGIGLSLLDGMLRLEYARGLYPDRENRLSFYLTPR